MIHVEQEEILKLLAQIHVNMITTGIMYLFIKGRTITWKVASEQFDMDTFKEGADISENETAVRAMKEKKIITEKIPVEIYGKRLLMTAIPLMDDTDNVIGAFSIIMPRVHPIEQSFNDFSPSVVELFPEGAYLYISDLTNIVNVQTSKNFSLPVREIGHKLMENEVTYKAVHSGQSQRENVGAEHYGVPVYISCHPIFDEDTGKDIVGSMGAVLPKGNAGKLRNMSENLNENLNAIAKTVEHLANSAANINENELALHKDINAVSELLHQINKIAEFITTVANQSNMLGLNASIEAARAGDAGKGFSVVADEIRKLSNQSKETVAKIRKLTDEIMDSIQKVNIKSAESLQASEEQAAASEEISASIEDLSAMTDELLSISKEL